MIQLRIADRNDGAVVAAIYAPIVRETAISFETEAPSPAEMAARIEATLQRFPWLVAVQDGAVIAYVYASAHRERPAYRWSVDVTAYVAETARRAGVASRLYRALFAVLKAQGFRSAFAGITVPNPASVALHESLGFKPLGVYEDVGFKLGAWRSVGWWRLCLTKSDCQPDEPTSFKALRESKALAAILG